MDDASIKLYIADHVSLGMAERWKVLFENLPEKDRERIGRFRFDADRIRGTLGTVMIRHFAGEAFPGEEIRINENVQ